MYTIKKTNNAEVLHYNGNPAMCPYAMVALPIQTALQQMQVIPVNRECSTACALFDKQTNNNIKLCCVGREINIKTELTL